MMRINMFNKKVWMILAIITLMGCSSETPGIPPDQLASEFYNAIINRDFKTAVSLYGGERPAEAHIQELQELESKLGDLQSYKLQDAETNTIYSGTRYILTYRLQYAKTALTENLIMFQSVRGEPLHIEHRNYELKNHVMDQGE